MKKALVTGASRGIGAAIARKLAENGYFVYVNYNNSKEKAESLAMEIGGLALGFDVSSPQEVEKMFEEIKSLDVLVCNAGISSYGLFTDLSFLEWKRIFATNVDGAYNCIQQALKIMLPNKYGSIINLSSIWGEHGASCEVAYSATKAAIIGLTKALAKELGPSNIRVNAIAPGVIETDMMKDFSEEDKAFLIDETPLWRLGTPEDIANLACFLASEASSFITGQVISADGGFCV